MSTNVTAIFGGPSGQPERDEACVEALREWLEMAESGEIVGVVLAGLCPDGCSRREIAGVSYGHGLIGAVEAAKFDLLDCMREE